MTLTELEKLKLENQALKSEINELKRKKYERIECGYPHISVIKYLDEDPISDTNTYRASSEIMNKMFKIPKNQERATLGWILEDVNYIIQEKYIQNALNWLMEDNCVHDLGRLKMFINKNIPSNVIIMNPRLYTECMRQCINTIDIYKIENYVNDILNHIEESK